MDNRVYFPDTFKTYEFAVDCYRLAKYLNANKIEFYVGNFSCDYDKDYDTIFFTNADFQGKMLALNQLVNQLELDKKFDEYEKTQRLEIVL